MFIFARIWLRLWPKKSVCILRSNSSEVEVIRFFQVSFRVEHLFSLSGEDG